jgi:hypothetical protein
MRQKKTFWIHLSLIASRLRHVLASPEFRRSAPKIILVLAIVLQLIPIHGGFTREFISPLVFTFIYVFAMFIVTIPIFPLALGVLLRFFPYIAVASLAVYGAARLVLYFARRAEKPFRKEAPALRFPLPPALRRIASFLSVFVFWSMVLGLIYTGFMLEPDLSAEAVSAGLVAVAVAGAVAGRYGQRSRLSGKLLLSLAALLPVLVLFRVQPAFYAPAEWLVFSIGIAALVYGSSHESRLENKLSRVFSDIVTCGVAAGVVALFFFAVSYIKSPEPDMRVFRQVSTSKRIFDLRYMPENGRLYFTSKVRPYVGYIDTVSGAVKTSNEYILFPRRIAAFPNRNRIMIGGGGGVVEFTLDLKPTHNKFYSNHCVDVENMDGDKLIIAREVKPEITIYDLATRKKTMFMLSGFPGWPYDVKYSPENRAFYVSNHFLSLYVHRYEHDDTHGTRGIRVVNGVMNVGMCLAPDIDKVLVARPMQRKVDILDAKTLKKDGVIPLVFGMREIQCDNNNMLLFAVSHFAGTLQIVDIRTRKVLYQGNAGRSARAVAYDPKNHVLFIGTKKNIISLDLNRVLKNFEWRD